MLWWSGIAAYTAFRNKRKGRPDEARKADAAALALNAFATMLSKKPEACSYIGSLTDAAEEAELWAGAQSDPELEHGFIVIARFFRWTASEAPTGRWSRDPTTGTWKKLRS